MKESPAVPVLSGGVKTSNKCDVYNVFGEK